MLKLLEWALTLSQRWLTRATQPDDDDGVLFVDNAVLVNVDIDTDVKDVDTDQKSSSVLLVKMEDGRGHDRDRSNCQCYAVSVVGVLVFLANIGFLFYCVNLIEVEFKTCKTLVCNKVGHEVKSYMDQNATACDDFYRYACGSWSKVHPMKAGDYQKSAFSEITEEDTRIIRDILASHQILAGAGDKARNFFLSCLNKDKYKPITTTTTTLETTEDDFFSYGDEDDSNDDDNDDVNDLSHPEKTFTKFHNELHPSLNIQDEDDLSRSCFTMTKTYFPDVISRLFVEKAFPNDKLEKVSEMLKEISLEYQSTVANLSWMDDATKTYLIAKLSNTSYQVGYPPSLLDIEEEVKVYSNLTISSHGSSYYDNVRVMSRHLYFRTSGFGLSDIPQANAWYNSLMDQIFIPAGIAQEPFFSADNDYPEIINYAKFATTLGHKYTHAFEEYTLSLWKWGRRLPNISSLSYYKLLDMKECFVDDYKTFKLANSSVVPNTEVTYNENLADVLGLQLAFAVFDKKYRKSYKGLPGLEEFTPEQIFFIAAAQVECRYFETKEIRQTALEWYANHDNHSPSSIRVRGKMANNDDFSKAFSCPIGSLYNPLKKCRVFF